MRKTIISSSNLVPPFISDRLSNRVFLSESPTGPNPDNPPEDKEEKIKDFSKEIETLINKYSFENDSNTPDFILADFIVQALKNFNNTSRAREKWYGKSLQVIDGGTTLESAIKCIEDLVKIQCQHGNWNYDGYMHGLANGLICALSCLTNKDPKYMEAPPVWLCDINKRGKRETNPIAPEKNIEKSSSKLNVRSIIKYCVAAIAEELNVDTLKKAYNVFRKIGITGFKTPKLSDKRKTIKACVIKTGTGKKYKILWIFIEEKDKVYYSAKEPGTENYSSDVVIKQTSNLNKFLEQLLGLPQLKSYHPKIKEYLGSI